MLSGKLGTAGENTRLERLDSELHKSLRDRVHNSLRIAIVSGQFAEGERLNERRLAEELGVSTTPLKEAFRQLEAEGLIESLSRRGVRVRFGKAWAEEMIVARATLESAIASIAARRIVIAQQMAMRETVSLMEESTARRDALGLVALNHRFHQEIHLASGCVHLTRLIDRQDFYDDTARRVIHRDPEQSRLALEEHRAICSAVTQHDEEQVESLMRQHVIRSGDHYIETIFNRPKGGR